MRKRTVGIFLFNDVEVLDFAGPFEVFSRTRLEPGAQSRRSDESAPFDVFTVAARDRAITATGGLNVAARYLWSDAPKMDIVVIPGGFGTRALVDDVPTAAWINDIAPRAEQMTSVCTGSLLLARAGLLANRQATTHHAAYELLASLDPSITVRRDLRVVHDGIISSAGVSAGIDMAFTVVEMLCGREVADETARYIEYPRTR
jgi:transcriptional regulator GlxA family with amidase domain